MASTRPPAGLGPGMVGALKGPWYLPVERFRMGMAHGTGAGQLVGSTYLPSHGPSHGCPDFQVTVAQSLS